MGGHQSANSYKDEWLTPPWILQKLGHFDLDPCAPVNRPWATAAEHYTVEHDGLSRRWWGRVWLNPPYGKHTGAWLARLAQHGNGVALVFARTETEMFHRHVWESGSACLFLEGRLTFYHVDGTRARHNGGAPSVLVAYGTTNAEAMRDSGIQGAFVQLEAC
jgi:hypothetical protein